MVSSASENVFQKLIAKKHENINSILNEVFSAYANFDDEAFSLQLDPLAAALDDFCELVVEEERPSWLTDLYGWIGRARAHKEPGLRDTNLKLYLQYLPYAQNFNWNNSVNGQMQLIDIDALIRDAEHKLNIPELFDETLRLVRELLSHEALDSLRAQKALQALTATLGPAKSKSIFHKKMAAEASLIVVKNLIKEFANSTPILGEALRSLEASVEEIKEKSEVIEGKYVQETLLEVSEKYEFQPKKLEDKRVAQIEDQRKVS